MTSSPQLAPNSHRKGGLALTGNLTGHRHVVHGQVRLVEAGGVEPFYPIENR